jgi:hypothetical protein
MGFSYQLEHYEKRLKYLCFLLKIVAIQIQIQEVTMIVKLRYFKLETHELVKALKLDLYVIQVVIAKYQDIICSLCRYCRNSEGGGIPPDSDWKHPLPLPPYVDTPALTSTDSSSEDSISVRSLVLVQLCMCIVYHIVS